MSLSLKAAIILPLTFTRFSNRSVPMPPVQQPSSIILVPKPLPTHCDHIKALKELKLYEKFCPDVPSTVHW